MPSKSPSTDFEDALWVMVLWNDAPQEAYWSGWQLRHESECT